MKQGKIDKILVSVFQRRFKSITEEMSIVLTKSYRIKEKIKNGRNT